MSVDEAIELGRRSIYHATFRDAVSGGTVSGMYYACMSACYYKQPQHVAIKALWCFHAGLCFARVLFGVTHVLKYTQACFMN